MSKSDKRLIIKTELTNYSDLTRSLDYGLALELFPIYFSINSRILMDIEYIKEYRNGLFHWKADDSTSFVLTKKIYKIFEWIFKFIEKKNGWWLGEEFNIIDPDFRKRKRFIQLKGLMRNEIKLIVQRRIFNYYNLINQNSEFEANRSSYFPEAVAFPYPNRVCAACQSNKQEIHWNTVILNNKKSRTIHFLTCRNCGFYCSDEEFKVMKNDSSPSLRQIVDEQLKSI